MALNDQNEGDIYSEYYLSTLTGTWGAQGHMGAFTTAPGIHAYDYNVVFPFDPGQNLGLTFGVTAFYPPSDTDYCHVDDIYIGGASPTPVLSFSTMPPSEYSPIAPGGSFPFMLRFTQPEDYPENSAEFTAMGALTDPEECAVDADQVFAFNCKCVHLTSSGFIPVPEIPTESISLEALPDDWARYSVGGQNRDYEWHLGSTVFYTSLPELEWEHVLLELPAGYCGPAYCIARYDESSASTTGSRLNGPYVIEVRHDFVIMDIQIEHLINPEDIPEYLLAGTAQSVAANYESPLHWYLGLPTTVEVNILPESLNTNENRSQISITWPSQHTSFPEEQSAPGEWGPVQFWTLSPGDVEAEFTINGVTVETSRTVDARDFFYQDSQGWDHVGAGSLVNIGAFASQIISGEAWNTALVNVDSVTRRPVTPRMASAAWTVITQSNFAGPEPHNHLYNTQWRWDTATQTAVRLNAWSTPDYQTHCSGQGLLDWLGYSVGTIDDNEIQTQQDYTMRAIQINCVTASLHSYGARLLQGDASFNELTNLGTPVALTLAGLSTHTFTGSETIDVNGSHSIRVLGAGTGTSVQVYSVNNKIFGRVSGHSTCELQDVIDAHQPGWTPTTLVTVYPGA